MDLVSRRSPSVNVDEASRGRVSYVRVKDWGSGKAEDVGELQVESSSQTFSAEAPFYEQVARRLEALQAEGALAVAQPAGAAPLPPFERWAFAEAHYVQHLADLLCVHTALEAAVARAQVTVQRGEPGATSRLADAVALFGAAQGLARAQHIATDLAAILGAPCDEAAPPPLPNAAAYAGYITRAAERCERAGDGEETALSAAKLLTSAFVVMLTLLTSGNRVGAAATEKLGLFARGAVNTYRTFPTHVERPLEAFVAAVNAAGEAMREAEREAFMAELPAAMQKTSLLLEALAKER